MTRDEAVARVQRDLGFRSDRVDEIRKALQEAQDELEAGRSLPYFLIEENFTLSLIGGVANYPLPTGFLKFYEDSGMWFIDPFAGLPSRELSKKTYEAAVLAWKAAEGVPSVYVLGRGLTFFPRPMEDGSVQFSYYKKQDKLDQATNVANNAWLVNIPLLLVGSAGKKVAHSLRDAGGYETFDEMYQDESNRLVRMIQDREDSGQQYAVGQDN